MNELDEDILTQEDEDLYEHHQFEVDKGQTPLRIDKYLMHKLQNASRTKIQAAAKSNSILVNGKAVKSNYKVQPSVIISIVLPYPPRDTTLYPEKLDITYVYEDKYLAIVNKDSNMVVHPGFNNYTGTLVQGLLYHFNEKTVPETPNLVYLAHRIDKNTTGLLVIGKDEVTLAHLANQFFNHSIERKYVALVWGNFEESTGTINANLDRDKKDRKKRSVPRDPEQGKTAVTHYKVLENFHFCSLIECELETGRTHQIRAHMAHIGHPIFSDEMYGGNKIWKGSRHAKFSQFIDNCFKLLPRQALHAKTLGFVHPNTKKTISFEAPIPEDLQTVIDKIRNYAVNEPG